MTTRAATQPHPSAVSRFFRNPRTGELAVVQMPNIPLWVFIAAAVVRAVLHPAGAVGTVISVVAGVSLAIWAVLEIVRGDSPFRRLLGAVVLAVSLLGYVLR